ncbi:MAG TPA: hypothetical protein DCK98_00730 [Chloroflexi bacterium]|nr:hypothetical protein [Chloroflexota bacterium]HAL27058.1 hypothetical protein [Chloroflexota bacterium]
MYAAVSAVLLATYIGGVAVLQTILAPLTAGSGVAVAISTLAVVALFQPLRTRIQAAVDRRFYRAKYDAVRTLDSFAVRLRDEIDLTALQAEPLGTVGETLQPTYASLWLRGMHRRRGLVRRVGQHRLTDRQGSWTRAHPYDFGRAFRTLGRSTARRGLRAILGG